MARRLAPIALVWLAVLLAAGPALATFSGRNGRIAFTETGTSEMDGPGTWTFALAVAAPATDEDPPPPSRELLFCEMSASSGCTLSDISSPSYSPDGRRIVFDAGEGIALVDANGRNLTVLPAVTENDGDPAFSKDGRRIVFTGKNEAGGTDVYVRRVDGRSARLVVEDAAEPAWSSRGALAWVRDRRVYVGAARGSGASPRASTRTGRRAAGAWCWCGRQRRRESTGGST